jgi:4-amino-4-deoxy-L-arabinose transferase-like glycosyltransferase
MLGSARRTSATFDEITMVALGARGYATGSFDLMPQHPPGGQYVYGLPLFLSGAALPDESLATVLDRYEYARDLYWVSNEPEPITMLSRLPAILMALALIGLCFAVTYRMAGPRAALIAAGLVALLPDVLAHGAIAYTDVPMALTYLAAVWLVDLCLRNPGLWRGVLAGLAIAAALSMKFSGLAVFPVVAILLLAEASGRSRADPWHGELRKASLAGLLTLYASLVLLYGGDVFLLEFLYGLGFTAGHVTEGHDSPAFLLGRTNLLGWWYFYPVAFLLKTPTALHLLILVAVAGFRPRSISWRSLATSRKRALLVGGGVFGLALLASNLNIGFRYALPVLPFICILTGIGVDRSLSAGSRVMKPVVAFLLVGYAVSSLAFYPHFLAYTSEYIPNPDRGYRAVVDSNLDWGQGLLELRDWMQDNQVEKVGLSYFGSALPWGYGIDYEPLLSHLELAAPPERLRNSHSVTHVAISATNLQGVYLEGDPFREYRHREPVAVLAHSLFIYDVD